MSATDTFRYEHCDVPPGVSLKQWRAEARPCPKRRALARAVARIRPHAARSSAA